MSDRSISRRQISIVAAFDDISEVIPHLMSTGTNSYPALLQIDDNLGQYFLVNSSRSSSSPPNGELKKTRAVLRCCLRLAFWKILWIILVSVHIYVSNNWAISRALIARDLSLRECRPCLKMMTCRWHNLFCIAFLEWNLVCNGHIMPCKRFKIG